MHEKLIKQLPNSMREKVRSYLNQYPGTTYMTLNCEKATQLWQMINHGFIWSQTPEGWGYWSKWKSAAFNRKPGQPWKELGVTW